MKGGSSRRSDGLTAPYVLSTSREASVAAHTVLAKLRTVYPLDTDAGPGDWKLAASECMDHLAAGIDTTGDGLCFLMHHLSLPRADCARIQRRLHEELAQHPAAPEALRAELTAAAREARDAYEGLARSLREEFGPVARESDAVGEDEYRLRLRSFLGARPEPAEVYAWGIEQLRLLDEEQRALAERIKPGATVREAMDALNADPARQLHSTDELRDWMQELSDAAVADLAGSHFEITEPMRRLECRIAPTRDGIIYYSQPSHDFSRPGRMWWSVPEGVAVHTTWEETTTVYHEGVPGHHLQIGQTVHRRDLLNRWRRHSSFTSGHAEGWALYAEWLMAELGYMDDPGNRMGLLDGQSLRAARVVLDIGVHCDFEAPAEVVGGRWDYDKAWAFLDAHANMEEGFLRFELDRYLGWPGQAPSYKVGERLWLQLREEARRRAGGAFDLGDFHRRALDLGGMGLDTLRGAVLGET